MGFVAACSTGRQRPTFGRSQDAPVRVEVTNNNFLSATVYASTDGSFIRVGDVGGKSSATFTLNEERLGIEQGVRFRVNPVGSRQQYLSPTVYPNRGSWVSLVIATELSLSHVSVR